MDYQWHDISEEGALQEPPKGTAFFQLPFPVHRFRASQSSLVEADFGTQDNLLFIPETVDGNSKGASCFVPLSELHLYNTPKAASARAPCQYLPIGHTLGTGQVLVFTDTREYAEPVNGEITYRKVWHFNLCPNRNLPDELKALKRGYPDAYSRSIRRLGWLECDIRGAAEPFELPQKSQFDPCVDEVLVRLHNSLDYVHRTTSDPWQQLVANEVHTYIARREPNFLQLCENEPLSRDFFELLCQVDLEDVGGDEAQFQVLCRMEEAFGWKWRNKYMAAEEAREFIRFGKEKVSLHGCNIPRNVASTVGCMIEGGITTDEESVTLRELWNLLDRNHRLVPFKRDVDYSLENKIAVPPITMRESYFSVWTGSIRYYTIKRKNRQTLFHRVKENGFWRYWCNVGAHMIDEQGKMAQELLTPSELWTALDDIREEESLEGNEQQEDYPALCSDSGPASLQLLHDEQYLELLRYACLDNDVDNMNECSYDFEIPLYRQSKGDDVIILLFLDPILTNGRALRKLREQLQSGDEKTLSVTTCTWKDMHTGEKARIWQDIIKGCLRGSDTKCKFGVINSQAHYEEIKSM